MFVSTGCQLPLYDGLIVCRLNQRTCLSSTIHKSFFKNRAESILTEQAKDDE